MHKRIPYSELDETIEAMDVGPKRDLLTLASDHLNGPWGSLNPYWLERSYVLLNSWRIAKLRYSSDQGTGFIANIRP
jgi:hypothetical protein